MPVFPILVPLGTLAALLWAAASSSRLLAARRLGPLWLPVPPVLLLAAAVEGILVREALRVPPEGFPVRAFDFLALAAAFLLVPGFALAGRWLRAKERTEDRRSVLAEVDRALVGLLEEEGIVRAVCEGLARRRGCRLAWIGRGEPDGRIRVLHVAGEGPALPEGTDPRWDDTEAGGMPPGKALRTGRACVAACPGEIAGPAWWKAMGASGIRHVAAAPVPSGRRPGMVLVVHADDRGPFDPPELEALSGVAARAGGALESARRHESFRCARNAYDDLLRAQRDGVVLVRGGEIVRANPAALEMLGYPSPDGLLGEDPMLLLAEPEAEPMLLRQLRSPDGEGGHFEREAAIRRRDGSSFPGELSVLRVPRDGRDTTFDPPREGHLGMIVLRDVTARKQGVEALARERDFAARVLDIAGALVARLGPDGEILLFNRPLERASGYAAAEAIGRPMADLLVPEAARPAFLRCLVEAFLGREQRDLEFPLSAKGGEERRVVWNIAADRGTPGRPATAIVTGADVTGRRQLEARILETRKAEALSALAAGVADGFEDALGGGGRVPADAATLVRQLRDFARVSAPDRRPVRPGELVGDAAAFLSRGTDRRIAVEVDVEEGLPSVPGDAARIREALESFAANARDAVLERAEAEGEAGRECRVVLRARERSVGAEEARACPGVRAGRFVRVSIEDNGAGLDEAARRRVFEPFFTTRELGRGNGLGLAAAWGIVRLHEGWIEVESRPGEGGAFHVHLPAISFPP